jgi:hypothetical protein
VTTRPKSSATACRAAIVVRKSPSHLASDSAEIAEATVGFTNLRPYPLVDLVSAFMVALSGAG